MFPARLRCPPRSRSPRERAARRCPRPRNRRGPRPAPRRRGESEAWASCGAITATGAPEGCSVRPSVLVLVDQLVGGDPRHHRAQARAGLLDRMLGLALARGLHLRIAGLVVEDEAL